MNKLYDNGKVTHETVLEVLMDFRDRRKNRAAKTETFVIFNGAKYDAKHVLYLAYIKANGVDIEELERAAEQSSEGKQKLKAFKEQFTGGEPTAQILTFLGFEVEYKGKCYK
jgi:cell division septum initiation protein DivIVA